MVYVAPKCIHCMISDQAGPGLVDSTKRTLPFPFLFQSISFCSASFSIGEGSTQRLITFSFFSSSHFFSLSIFFKHIEIQNERKKWDASQSVAELFSGMDISASIPDIKSPFSLFQKEVITCLCSVFSLLVEALTPNLSKHKFYASAIYRVA